MEPKIVTEGLSGFGQHNQNIEATNARLKKGGTYKDVSTVIVCPTRGLIPCAIVQSWMNIIRPMNQKVIGPIFIEGMEVGAAYSTAVDMILGNPDLSQFKYMMTIEEDNMIPPDALLKLYESIEGEVDGQKYDCVGGLYWTKGEGGQPMIYGNPFEMPKSFIPQMPVPEAVQPANGLGMGCSLFRIKMFKDPNLPKPFFQTLQKFTPGVGTAMMTQDLFFFQEAGKLGYRFASDNRVKVGHRDVATGMVW